MCQAITASNERAAERLQRSVTYDDRSATKEFESAVCLSNTSAKKDTLGNAVGGGERWGGGVQVSFFSASQGGFVRARRVFVCADDQLHMLHVLI